MKHLKTVAAGALCSLMFACGSGGSADLRALPVKDPGVAFIPKDSANKMVLSYLNSIDTASFGVDTPQLRSLSIAADALRSYLNQSEDISHIKIMFAHTLEYINSGRGNQNAGYQSGAFTLVMAAYDSRGNYVLADGMVLNRSVPCPSVCVGSGTAQYDLIE